MNSQADEARDASLAAAIGALILDGSVGSDAHSLDKETHLRLVRRAAEADTATQELLRRAVAAARADGISWATIGDELGLSRQGVQQRFGRSVDHDPGDGGSTSEGVAAGDVRWLGPVTALDEMAELELAGTLGWRTVEVGMLRHKMLRTTTQWQHRRVLWTRSTKHYLTDGWQVGVRAFPWLYLVRDLGIPPEIDAGAR